MTKIQQIKQFAKDHLDDVRWVHTQQVVKMALEIARKEGANLEVVEISAWMHDTGTWQRKNVTMTHQIYSAKYAREIMEKIDYSQKTIDRVFKCIIEHSGPITDRTPGLLKKENATWDDIPRPSSIESKCLYDADMTNLCGPFGLAKMLYFQASKKKFSEIIQWQKILSASAYHDLKTKTGKQIGKKYHQTSTEMFKLFNL
ncbi:MAG: hypothetical protein ACD_58C00092G0017 [uncultured bacterium]|nr:MAG: hypothetical protein ACD_58C00092G0017 [uncultured bacterium]